MTTIGLVRLTVSAPRRRVDIALPEHVPVAEFAAAVLQHAGEELGDDGTAHGGWALRRADGTRVDLARTLAAQQVHDGEVLHLLPGRTEWPELEYDDLVDAIAAGARRHGQLWGPLATRRCGLAVAAAALLAGLVVVLGAGAPWPPAARYLCCGAALLLLAGTALSRAFGDSGAGAVLGLAGLGYAAVGGALLPAGTGSLTSLGTPQLLAAGAALAVAGLAGYAGIADRTALFSGAAALGALAMGGGWVATTSLDSFEAAAVFGTAVVLLLPLLAPIAVRIGRLPRPALPRSANDLLDEDDHPARSLVYAAVLRTDALLSGLLLAAGATVAWCEVVLVRAGDASARVLVVGMIAALLLRSRLLPVVRHRVPVLLAALLGLVALLFGVWLPGADPLSAVAPGLVAVAGLVVAGTLRWSRQRPGAYLGRFAEIAELLTVLALIPIACSVLGLYARVRGLGG